MTSKTLTFLACALALTGCGPDEPEPGGPVDMGAPDMMPIVCTPSAANTVYRVRALHIPTPAEANGGTLVVGHNVDGVGDTCGIPDYSGGVDNSLIDLAAALPGLAPDDPVDLQAEIDAALACGPTDVGCTPLELDIHVQTDPGVCASITVFNGEGTMLAGPFGASLDASGNLRGTVPSLALSIPYQTDTGSVDIDLAVTNVVMSARLNESTLEDIVLGGSLEKTAFETTIMQLLPQLGGEITFEQIAPILAGLYDVQVGGSCEALSVGLTGRASVSP